MASLEQWTEWRDEYYAGLKQIIDNAPYRMTQIALESEGVYFDQEAAKAFVEEAINAGVIKESEPLSFLKKTFFAMAKMAADQDKKDVSIQDVEALCHEPDYPYLELTSADDYISYVLLVFYLSLIRACRYVFSNHPRACKNVIIDLYKRAGEEIDFSYFRLRKEELFDYFRSVTPFCLHNMLADMKCPYAEEVFDAVQDGNYEFFKILCYDKNIDFTELSEIVGYLQSGLVGSINDSEDAFESDEGPDEGISDRLYSRLKNVSSMAGFPLFNQEDFEAGVYCLKKDYIGELLPFIQTEEEASMISAIAFDIANMYSYIERMDDGELKEINRLLDHSDFEVPVKLAQTLFCVRYDRFPNNVTIHYSPEEQSEMISGIQEAEKVELGDAGWTNVEDEDQKPQLVVTDELHWPTDEELEGYENNYNSSEYFAESIFGVAPNIKASDVEQLYNCLTQPKLKVLEDNLETKLIFLSRYTGKKIPHLELRQLEWKVLNDGDKALGYLIKTTGAAKFATGIKFFYYLDRNGEKTQFEREPVAEGGHAWAKAGRQEKTRGQFEKELNKFIEKYQEEHSE